MVFWSLYQKVCILISHYNKGENNISDFSLFNIHLYVGTFDAHVCVSFDCVRRVGLCVASLLWEQMLIAIAITD